MKSYDMSIVNSMQSISAVQTTTGNCIHCMQDARLGLFNPEEHEDEQTYLVATENCEIHEFRGDNWMEASCRRIRRRTCGCIGRVAHDTERERLPFAFVTLNKKLLANCEQQLVRQTGRPDGGAMGDCYTFAARHSFYQKLLVEHWNFVSDGEAASAMMKAFERETGIDVQSQEDLMVNLRRGNRDTVTAVLKALRD